jgi:hypothetical protein
MSLKDRTKQSLEVMERACKIYKQTLEKYPEKSLKDQCSRLIDLLECEIEILEEYMNGQE